ncbi:MAG: hypothetical protein ACJ74W_05030 [Pyrinomonadaceae bacterium]
MLMLNWLKAVYYEVRPNALWDVIKYMIIVAVSLLAVGGYRLLAWTRQLPPDRVIDFAIFAGAFILLTFAYVLTKLMKRETPSRPAVMPQTQTQEGCPAEWLHNIAEYEKDGIQYSVKITLCTMRAEELNSDVPYINFKFHILNCSVYPITIEESIEGYIQFISTRLGGHMRMVDNKIKDCLHGNTGFFVIRQWLSKEEVTLIRNAPDDRYFRFDNLKVTVKGGKDFTQVIPRQLEITCMVEKTGRPVM